MVQIDRSESQKGLQEGAVEARLRVSGQVFRDASSPALGVFPGIVLYSGMRLAHEQIGSS